MPFPCTLTDARGAEVTLDAPPRRIVSLVPSQTELLAFLGLDEAVVGLTRFCVRPEGWTEQKEIVGGTKQVNAEHVRALAPDLMLANREENTREDVETLEAMAPVYVTDVPDLPAALRMIRAVGRLTARAARAEALAAEIARRFDALENTLEDVPIRAAYLIWRDPYMAVGRGTFIHDVMRRAGFANVFAGRTRYPEITTEDLRAAAPHVLLCADEPFPFHQKPRFTDELRAALPEAHVEVVDGQLFSWYGPRLLRAPAYLARLHARLTERLARDAPNRNDA